MSEKVRLAASHYKSESHPQQQSQSIKAAYEYELRQPFEDEVTDMAKQFDENIQDTEGEEAIH